MSQSVTTPVDRQLRPLAAPLVLDAAAYGLALLGLFLGPAAARGLWRRRTGRCAPCGYDRRGLAPDAKCPECGAPATTWPP